MMRVSLRRRLGRQVSAAVTTSATAFIATATASEAETAVDTVVTLEEKHDAIEQFTAGERGKIVVALDEPVANGIHARA